MIASIIATILFMPWGGVVMMSPMMFLTEGYGNDLKSILTSMLFLYYPVFIFLTLKLFGFRFFKTDPINWMIGVIIIASCVCMFFGVPKMIFNIGRGVANRGFGKTQTNAYFNGNKLSNIDVKSFRILGNGASYAADDYKVYYRDQTLEGADPKTFSFVGATPDYFWKDHKSIYINGKRVEGSESESFEEIELTYWKDRNHVYYGNKILSGADPKTFRLMKENRIYSKDKKYVFYSAALIEEADAETFSVAEGPEGLFWKDHKFVYVDGSVVKGSHGPSYQHIGEFYWKDNFHVYHRAHLLPDAHKDSFILLDESGVAKDQQNIYVNEIKAQQVQDVASFKVFRKNYTTLAKDKFNLYGIAYQSEDPVQIFPNADEATFNLLDSNYAKDKSHVYYFHNKIGVILLEGVKPEEFKVEFDSNSESDARAGNKRFFMGKLLK